MSETIKRSNPASDVARELASDATETLAVGAQEFGVHFVAEPAKDLLSLANK